jgi:membrane associated rhomboid family serine protease
MTATDDVTLGAGVRWLATKRVTLGVFALLLAVFGLELFVWWLFGPATWQYLFLADAMPSPAWVLAQFAHRSIEHLVTTSVVILVYGALLEGRLGTWTFLGFYLAAGYASTAAQLGEYVGGTPSLGTLGASGAALGLVALFTTTTIAAAVGGGSYQTEADPVFAVSGVFIVGTLLVNDFVSGIQIAAGTAPFGHVGGMLTGVFYGLVRVRAQHRRRRRS